MRPVRLNPGAKNTGAATRTVIAPDVLPTTLLHGHAQQVSANNFGFPCKLTCPQPWTIAGKKARAGQHQRIQGAGTADAGPQNLMTLLNRLKVGKSPTLVLGV